VLLKLVVFDLLEHLLPVLVEVGRKPIEHLLKQHTQQIPVHALAVAGLVDHFGRQLGHTPTETRSTGVVHDFFFRQPEVSQFSVALLVQHYIVRLQVPLDHIFGV